MKKNILISVFLYTLFYTHIIFATDYSYDDVGRLRLVDYGGGNTQVYSYDSAGNIAEVKSTTTTDTTPDAFGFTAQTNVVRSTLVTSAPVAITGINAATNWSVTNGTACVGSSAANCGCADSAFTTSGTVSNNQYVCAQHTSSASYATKTTTTVTVGGVSGNFDSTTAPQTVDTKPDPFTFTAQTNVALSSTAESNVITVKGINSPTPISVTANGFYRINGGVYVKTAGKVNNGDKIQVKHTTAATVNTNVSTTLTIGGVNGVFKTTTATTKDTTPNAFSFAAKTNVALSSIVESAVIKVGGINAPTPISVSAGSFYRINGGGYVNIAGKVNNGDTVQVKHTAAANYATVKSTTLTIGGVTGVFKSKTLPAPTLNTPENVVATAGNGMVTLSWNTVNGATGYEVCRAQGSINDIVNCSAIDGGAWYLDVNSPLVISGLSNGMQYHFKVRAKNGTTYSPASAEVTAIPTDGVPKPSLHVQFDETALNDLGATYFGLHSFTTGYDGGSAIKFYGVDQPGHVQIPNRAAMQFTDGATFDMWVRIDARRGMNGYGQFVDTGAVMALLAKSHDRTGVVIPITPESKSGAWFATFDASWSDANCQVVKNDFNLPLNSWFRVTMVASSTGGTASYINRQLAYKCPNARPNFTTMNTQDLYIGKFSDSWYPLDGAVESLDIYQQALSQEQVTALPQTMKINTFNVNGQSIANGGSIAATTSDLLSMVLTFNLAVPNVAMELPAPYGKMLFGTTSDGGVTWQRQLTGTALNGTMRLYPTDKEGNALPDVTPWIINLAIKDSVPKLTAFGAWEQLEGKPFDVVFIGDDAANINQVTAGTTTCSFIGERSSTTTKHFACTTPSSNGSDQSAFAITATVSGKSINWVNSSNFTTSLNYWNTYNGVPYVIGLDKYVVSNSNGIGPLFNITMGATSGNLGDIPPSSFFSSLTVGGYNCPKVGTMDWAYQCPMLPLGTYLVNVLFDNDKRRMVNQSFVIKVQ